MKIRPANLSDISGILPMIAKICELHQSWDSAKYGFLPNPELLYESWLGQLIKSQRNLCLVAEIEASDLSHSETAAKLAGFLLATVEREIPIYRLKEFAFIHDIWVEAEHRRAGTAHQMIEQAIEHFTRLGIAQIRLDTAANEPARKLFSSCGFRPSTTEMLIELPIACDHS